MSPTRQRGRDRSPRGTALACASGSKFFVRFICILAAASVSLSHAQPPSEPTKLLIAFASTRERRDPPYPKIYFYEHDGVGKGKVLGSVDSVTGGTNKTRADMHPSLSRDGRWCAFSAQFGVQDGARVEIWDRKENKLIPLPSVQETPKVHQMGVSLAGDGKLVAYSAWARPGSAARWGVFLYDLAGKKTIDPPKLNHEKHDQRMPAISGDGRFLAFASNVAGGVGSTDVYLYDLVGQKTITLPEMNAKGLDIQPALNGDGRLVAFVSERLGGAGERDIYLYDRETQMLLPTPGLNSKEDDFDPCLRVLSPTR